MGMGGCGTEQVAAKVRLVSLEGPVETRQAEKLG